MKKASLIAIIGICAFMLLASGCTNPELQGLKDKNQLLAKHLADLRRERDSAQLELNQCKEQLATAKSLNSPQMQALKDQVALLNEDIAAKVALINRMRDGLLKGVQLPMELSLALKEFAENNDMVTFDEATGILKFKSDLLFKSGSADVVDSAKAGIASLAGIMNSETAGQFHMVVAGHTDSDPIRYSKNLHKTNWHLSAHRAIAVLELMAKDGVSPKRLSARGFGQQRPLQPNDTKQGKAANRRVEIYVIAAGM
jgi:chemotaxis protein MotB